MYFFPNFLAKAAQYESLYHHTTHHAPELTHFPELLWIRLVYKNS